MIVSIFKLKALLVMSAVFGLGTVVGASWSAILLSRYAVSHALPAPKKTGGTIDRLKLRLNLTPEQTQSVDSILNETHRELRLLHLTVKPQFEQIRQSMRSAVRQILNEQQQGEYAAMLRERDAQRAKGTSDKGH
jgi:hypothetical protein